MTFPASVLLAAERVLSDASGSPVRIARCDPLTEELSVARCELAGNPDVPRTVIVRTHRSRGSWRTEPAYLLNDHAATVLLDRIGGTTCARLIGADLTAGVQVTEDLGTGPALDDLLAGDDRAAATAGVLAWARALGELHASTAGRAEEYDRLRGGFGSPMPAGHRISLVERRVDLAWATLATRAAGRVPADVHTDAERLLRDLREPGRLLALSNGDTCPYNCRITPDGVRFFDFELAGFRNCLLDAAYLRIPFPSCYRWGRLPEPLLIAAESAYRSATGLDKATYLRGLAGACGAWAISRAERLPPTGDLTGPDERLSVARAVAVGTAFVETARAAESLPHLAGWFERLAARLQDAGGHAVPEPPLFPAFA